MNLREILAARRAGCDRCYSAFNGDLEPLRPRTGSAETALASAKWRRWRALSAELAEAVLTEDFERAAALKRRLDGLRATPPG